MHRHFARQLTPSGSAESWEIVDRKEGSTILCRGPLEGLSLTELMQAHSAMIMGGGYEGPFPFLAKLIDAREALSLQVHPNEESALRHGGEAKSEAWYIIATEGEAHIWLGKREGVSLEAAKKSLVEGSVREVARRQAVFPGDAYYVPGGLVHAIGGGILLFELQQNSNTTYRVDDWGRGRQLHLKEASLAIDWEAKGKKGGGSYLMETPYFHLERGSLKRGGSFSLEGPAILFLTEGEAQVRGGGVALPWYLGESCLIPASLSDGAIFCQSEHMEWLYWRLYCP